MACSSRHHYSNTAVPSQARCNIFATDIQDSRLLLILLDTLHHGVVRGFLCCARTKPLNFEHLNLKFRELGCVACSGMPCFYGLLKRLEACGERAKEENGYINRQRHFQVLRAFLMSLSTVWDATIAIA